MLAHSKNPGEMKTTTFGKEEKRKRREEVSSGLFSALYPLIARFYSIFVQWNILIFLQNTNKAIFRYYKKSFVKHELQLSNYK